MARLDRAKRTQKFNILFSSADIEAIREFAKTQSDDPYITESVRRIVRQWLDEHGYRRDGGNLSEAQQARDMG